MRRVFVMSSSGLASSTMKPALFPGATVPASVSRMNSAAVARRRDDDLRRRHTRRDHVGHLEVRAPRHVAVGAERDLHAFAREPLEVARLNREERLRLGAIGRGGLQLRDLLGGKLEREPAHVLSDAAIRQVRHDHEARPLLEHARRTRRRCRLAHAVRERVDAAAHELFRIGEVILVRGHAQAVRVGFLDDGAVELGRELRVLAHAVVDPDLDDVDAERGLLTHAGAPFLGRRDPVRNVGAARLRRREAAARRAIQRVAGDRPRGASRKCRRRCPDPSSSRR